MRQAEVETLFLQDFGRLYPQLTFRSLRRFPSRRRSLYAFALRVAFGKSGPELDLLCVLLSQGHPQEVEAALRRVQEAHTPSSAIAALPVLVAPYFDQEAQQLCISEGVAFMDLSGNATLETPQVYLHISGRANRHVSRKRVRSLYEGKAERVVRRLLLEPTRQWRMRDLAREAHVSLGLASMVSSALAENGLVEKGRQGVSLTQPVRLLDAYAEHYDLQQNKMHTYRAWRRVPQLLQHLAGEAERLQGGYALTLWSAAHRLLQRQDEPPHLALYWNGSLDLLANILRLDEKVGRTYVFIFQPYDESLLWDARQTPDRLRFVHPLQLYLDLRCGDQTEQLLAQRVRTRLLGW